MKADVLNTLLLQKMYYLHFPAKLRKVKFKILDNKPYSPEGKWRFSCTLSLTSELDGGGWSRVGPGRSTPRKRHAIHFTRDLLGPRVSLERCGKRSFQRDSILRRIKLRSCYISKL